MQNIVKGQRVSPAKRQIARELRGHMTGEEQILWEKLRAHRLLGLHFRRQQVIDGFIADFYCHTAGLVVEVDGRIHDKQVEQDRHRDRVFEQRGLKVLRVTNDEVRQDIERVLDLISSHLTHR